MGSLGYIILYIIYFAISVAILRWILRINVIIEKLDDIAASNHKISQDLEMIKASLEIETGSSKLSENEDESHHDK